MAEDHTMYKNEHSLSLAVKDIEASIAFYENLGFTPVEDAGSVEENWIIMENGSTRIGLFQDMFDENIITFNPGDARSIYHELKEKGVKFLMESDSIHEEKGPCHFCIEDPDGNQILFDQHYE